MSEMVHIHRFECHGRNKEFVPLDEYRTLRDERDRLREALQPFAERWEYFERTKHPSGGEWPEDLEYADDEPSTIYLGQLKAAKAALTPAGGQDEHK